MSVEVFILPTGRPFFDLIFAGIPNWAQPGQEVFADSFKTCAGGSFNIAYAMHKLGLDVGFCAHLGNDFFSGVIREAAKEAGLCTDYVIEHDKPMAAVTASMSRFDDRALLSYVDPVPEFDAGALPEHGVPNVIFVPGIPEKPEVLFDYLDEKDKEGSMLVCDCAHIERDLDDEAVSGLIKRMDLFLCNEKEAQTLTHRSAPERQAMILGALCDEVVIKMGPEGAMALEGGLVMRERAIPISVRDTTGAGDGFNAGYVYGLLEGYLVERRLRLANVVGGVIASGMGCEMAPTLDQTLELEEKHYM